MFKEIKQVQKHGGRFVTVKHVTKSSSKIIKKLNLDLDNSEFSNFIKEIRSKYSIIDFQKSLEKIKKFMFKYLVR